MPRKGTFERGHIEEFSSPGGVGEERRYLGRAGGIAHRKMEGAWKCLEDGEWRWYKPERARARA